MERDAGQDHVDDPWSEGEPVASIGPERDVTEPSPYPIEPVVPPLPPPVDRTLDTPGSLVFDLGLIGRRWWVVLFAVVVAIGASYVIWRNTEPTYASAERMILSVNLDMEDAVAVNAASVLRDRVVIQTYAEMLQSDTYLEAGLAVLGENPPVGFESRAVVVPEANIVELTVTGPLQDVVAPVTEETVDSATTDFLEQWPMLAAQPLSFAERPDEPAAPVLWRDVAFAGALGILVGIVIAAIWPYKPTRRRHAATKPLPARSWERPGVDWKKRVRVVRNLKDDQ